MPEELKPCDGNCIKHKGSVTTVTVYDPQNATNWGKFNYCENAVKFDRDIGFIVKTWNKESWNKRDTP